MSNIVIGVGDLAASNTPGSVIKTYALGSCVAVILMHPRTRTVGMVHVVLPDTSINPAKAKEKPGYFADSGISSLLGEMAKLGCQKNGAGMIVKMAGGAQILDNNNTFNIGKRNILAVKKTLWQFGLGPMAEDVGGTISRTVSVCLNTGETLVTSPARPPRKL